MTYSESAAHPGPYIKSSVIPKGMTVSAAAKLLDVGRPALSNLLNGNAALSTEMSARLEKAFGVNARDLLDMQAAYDVSSANTKKILTSTKTYVPPFLQIKAREIETWADTIHMSRSRLAVFLRMLIGSTSNALTRLAFPGNDDAELPGWDGQVETGTATPWIPAGRSGWEFGVTKNVRSKADGDYSKSVDATAKEERKQMVFVFVTPRKWDGKASWLKAKKDEKIWKDVWAFDATDLEQWLEHSIPAQTWLAAELGRPAHGVYSLDEAWRRWAADCDPIPVPALFDSAIQASRLTVKANFSDTKAKPLIVTADSVDEAVAFLACLFAPDDPELGIYRNRIAVFSEAGALRALAAPNADFIPVVTTSEIEKELSPFSQTLRSIIEVPLDC